MREEILEFKGDFRWLSNFIGDTGLVIRSITYPDIIANNVELIYHAEKCVNRDDIMRILAAGTPGKAKRVARQIELRPDWDAVKLGIMEQLVRQKFSQPPFQGLLLSTNDAYIEEGNYWHDNYWGVCHCSKCGGNGENHLGKILMKIREEFDNAYGR